MGGISGMASNISLTGLARDLEERAKSGKPIRIGLIGAGSASAQSGGVGSPGGTTPDPAAPSPTPSPAPA